MASKVGVDFRVALAGMKEAQAALRDFHPTLQKKLERKATRKAAKVVELRAKDYAPFDTGDLEEAIKVRSIKRSRNKVGASAVVGDGWYKGDQFYASFIEFGAPGHKTFGRGESPLEPQPFMRPAAEDSKDEVRQVYLATLRQIIAETKVKRSQGLINEKGVKVK